MKLWLATVALLAVLVASATVLVATSKPPAQSGPTLNVTIPAFDQAAAERQAAGGSGSGDAPAPAPAEAVPTAQVPTAPAGVGVTTTVE